MNPPVSPFNNVDAVGNEELVGIKEQLKTDKTKLIETEIELDEADGPKVHSRIFAPSPDEYNKHCATLLPYRSWCPICVATKKKNPGHRKSSSIKEARHISVLSMDYMYMNEAEDEKNYPVLVIYDKESQGTWTIVVKRKR